MSSTSNLLKAAQTPPIVEEWGSLTWVASRAIGNVTDLTLGRVVIKVGQSNPRHCHPDCEEVLLLLTGRLEHSVGDENYAMEPGDTIAIPAGVFHQAIATGGENAEMIVSYSSGERGFALEE